MSNDNSKLPANKAAFDPGWNDPPMFSYGTTPPSAAGKSKLNLNKRVAFPLQPIGIVTSSTTLKTPLASSGLPMPFSGSIVTPSTNFSTPPPSKSTPGNVLPPPTTSSQHPVIVNEEVTIKPTYEINDCQRQSYIITILDQTITSLSENNTNELKEIIKRIEILKSSYNRLDPKIQTILYSIANSIDNKNIPEATNFHRSLVVDYLHVCSQWAPALRQLILMAQAIEIIEHPENEEQVPFYSNILTDTTTSEIPIIPASQDVQKPTTKHNFSKIYHI